MSAVRGFIVFRLKSGIDIKKEDITYFSPGGYSFTRTDGRQINFDFEENIGRFVEEDRLFDFNLREIDNDLISEYLQEKKYTDLIKDQYDVSFFKDGSIKEDDEISLCMDINSEEVNALEYVEPVFFEVFDPYDEVNSVILLNKLTDKEQIKYLGRYDSESSRN